MMLFRGSSESARRSSASGSRATAFLILVLCSSARPGVAGDWPQILGPERNGIAAADERLARNWSGGSPSIVWERAVGAGFAGVAVSAGRVFLFHRVKEQEVLEALQVQDGTSLWKEGYATTFYPSVGGGDGPLCVPTVVGDLVITFGAQGVLTARDVTSGKQQWQHETHREFGAQEGYFGAGSSPVVIGQIVIVNVGGDRKTAGIVGFDLRSGKLLWNKTSEQAGYSSPVLARLDSQVAVICVTRFNCVALDPKTGAVFWQFKFGQRGPTVNGAVPLILDDHLFLTSSYGIGASYSRLGLLGPELLWQKDGVLSSQYATPIEHEGLLYGIHGRDDVPPADFRCIDPGDFQKRGAIGPADLAGKVLWSEVNFGYATLLKADGKLVVLTTGGELQLIEPNRERLVRLGRAKIFPTIARALPAFSNGRLYARDEKTLKCLDLSPAAGER